MNSDDREKRPADRLESWPPDWLKPDVELLLRTAADGALYTRVDSVTITGWIRNHQEPARPVNDDRCSALGLLEEHGFLAPSGRAELTDESGDTFPVDHIEITRPGRDLLNRLHSH